MPITTPPLPPQTPQQASAEIFQTQDQSQYQDATYNNGYSPSLVDNADSNSTSNAENSIQQRSSNLNVQSNYNNDSFFRYSGGTHIPNPITLTGAATYDNFGNYVATAGIQWNIGGRAKKLAYDEIALNAATKTAALCTGLVKQGVTVDYELAPQYKDCEAFKAVPKLAVVPSAGEDLTELKAQLKETMRLNKKLQIEMQAAQIRANQMQNAPTPISPGW